MIKLSGLNAYKRKTEKQKKQITTGATNYVKKVVRAVLKDLVNNTPQWSGNTAASWSIVITGVDGSDGTTALYREDWEELSKNPSFRGDPRAWAVARQENVRAFTHIRYNSNIQIVNRAPFADELATNPDVEKTLRSGNYMPGDVMAIEMVRLKYKISSNIVGLQTKRILALSNESVPL